MWNVVTQKKEVHARQWSATSAQSVLPATTYSRAPASVLPSTSHTVVLTSQFVEMTWLVTTTSVRWGMLRVMINSQSVSSFAANVVFTYLLTYLLPYLFTYFLIANPSTCNLIFCRAQGVTDVNSCEKFHPPPKLMLVACVYTWYHTDYSCRKYSRQKSCASPLAHDRDHGHHRPEEGSTT